MNDVEGELNKQVRLDQLRDRHRDSGLWDETLVERYATRQDLVAFMDETHRVTSAGDQGYYGMSAVVFHADDLPELRREMEEIAGSTRWHAKEAARRPDKAPTIARMNECIADKSAFPVIVFEVRGHEIEGVEERAVRDICLERALKRLDSEGITDVVMDAFPAQFAQQMTQDQAVVERLRGTGGVDDGMWMHHASMAKEHALWSADSVAWSVQRHHFGERGRDSAHIEPLRGKVREIHAYTGAEQLIPIPSRMRVVPPFGNETRNAPIYDLNARVQASRQAARSLRAAPLEQRPAHPAAGQQLPPQDRGGPSRSL